MQELSFFRPSYVVQRGDTEDRCPEAHRVVRNAIAIARVLHDVPSSPTIQAMSAIERAETPDDGVSFMTSNDAALVAAVLEEVYRVLDASLDREWRPQGPAAKDILDEAALPSTEPDGRHDRDRVFEITPEGRVALQYPRIPLPELLERLPEVAAFLRRAADQGDDIAFDD